MLLVVLVFSFALFGITGARVVLGIIFISSPFYFMLNNFEFNESEKFVFSVLMGLTIFPSLVYILGLLISFRVAIIIVFIVLVGFCVSLRLYNKRKRHLVH